MLKKFFALLLVLMLLPVASLAETVVTSFYPIFLFARQLTDGLEGVEVHNLAAPGVGCLHDVQLQTGDMKALHGADVFLINGAGMESYLTRVLEAFPTLPVVDASQGIELLTAEATPVVLGDSEEEENAHIWLDAQKAAQMVENLSQGLQEALPAHKEKIQENCAQYTARLLALHEELKEAAQPLTNRDIIPFHEAFPYFAATYNFHVAAVVAREPGEALSPAQLSQLARLVESLGTPPLFVEPQYEDLAAQTLARETGAKVYTLDPIVTGPVDPSLTYYEDMMRTNMETLKTALGE